MDPVPLEPSIFFSKLPRELRDQVYEYASWCSSSRDSTGILPSYELAAPLLTCRQFYSEANVIAFANIDWCINWARVHRKYYDCNICTTWLCEQSHTGESACSQHLSDSCDVGGIASLRSPMDLTVNKMIERAGLFSEQRTALRYLTIADFWFDFTVALQALRPENPVLYHLLHDFGKASTRDCHLDGLHMTLLEPVYDAGFYGHHALRSHRADVKIARVNTAQFQSMQSAKSVILEHSSHFSSPSQSGFYRGWLGHWPWHCFTLVREKRGRKEEDIHHRPNPEKNKREYYLSDDYSSLDWVWLSSLNLERLGWSECISPQDDPIVIVRAVA
ncbi:hypothetical protein HBI56_060750 [Parastagonospora nodorum]|nr:hypothetical protein HBH52_172070 [Parastagonospora nodorum]KAH4036212.1 hypothetical protein HBI09_084140 [Parastagonospora nodorum]KAH4106175.1 hypothetical protein HBH46_076180 [Parastagonospora nodorum]KAH4118929.1 hypothetical protein HBH47_132240 [Parastagonospora nodorum]KAH4204300.1 hypothetical protein HBI95_150880 [Parastagonospora nodorum]